MFSSSTFLSHEIGESVDVVEVETAIAVVDDVLDAANLDIGFVHDALHGVNDLVRRRVAFDAQAGFGRVHGAGAALEFLAGCGLADVGRAEVKSFSREMDLDSIKKLCSQHFHADNVAAARRNVFLHQRSVVQAKVERVGLSRGLKFLARVVARDSRAAASDVGLYHDGETQTAGSFNCVGGMIDDSSSGIGKSQRIEQ